jgi:hypothetical protein
MQLVSIGEKNSIYCGRSQSGKIPPPPQYGWLGNPIKLGAICPLCNKYHAENGTTLLCYENYLRTKINQDPIFKTAFLAIPPNSKLSCFCKDKTKCHTSILAKVHKELTK